MCEKCGASFPIQNGVVDFIDIEKKEKIFTEESIDIKFQKEQMFNSSTLAKLINLGSNIISCDYTPFNQLNIFVDGIDNNAIVVELGSGNRRLMDDCINVDIFPFPNVDILADIKKTPFGDDTVDFVIIDTVLEHVPEPHTVVRELYRILKPGGKAFCVVPFIFPYHGYPKNFFNISKDGLLYLFRDFKECKIEMYRGPTSAIINIIAEYVAIVFSGNKRNITYTCFRGVTLMPIFLFKYLDRLWKNKDGSLRISNCLCAIITK